LELFNFFGALCNLTHLRRKKQNPRIGDRVVLSCNSWRQAQVCMTLARVSDDPALKLYYEELALKFAENAANEHDLNNTSRRVSPTEADSGNINRRGR
jgi:hypothetical protein